MSTAVADAAPSAGSRLKAGVQRVGGNLASMVMPNIAAFLAWGLITALFIPTGWWPNETMANLVGPIVLTLLPLLIGYTGGRLVHGQRGAVVGAVATMGVIVGADIPMFLGAMAIGPLAAFILKKVDEFTESRIRPGFEMLVENFTAGIVGAAMAAAGLFAIGPVVRTLTQAAGNGVQFLIDSNLLPFVHLIIEPAKILFLNNAINHGVLSPLGIAESAADGQSILFLLEPNPGVGLGILVAYFLFGPIALRASTPAAMIIHFAGGIHEIYFPYVLMKPRLILAAIAGGAAGTLTFLITGAGLVATPSPGSIFALMALTPRGGWLGVLAGVLVSAVVTFLVAGVLMKFGRGEKVSEEEAAALYDDAQLVSAANKPA
jgi:mannitol-specific phosphotransferase system IIC component